MFCPTLLRDWRLPRARKGAAIVALVVLTAVLLSWSVAQDTAPRREFSARLLMRMGTQKSGIGARVFVKQDNVYLDFPDVVNGRRIPFWFLSDGTVESVKAATDEDFNPGPANPVLAGTLLRFRPSNLDHFCEEFRSYSIAIMKAGAEGLSDEARRDLQRPENSPCERTGDEMVAGHSCLTYRVAGLLLGSEYWTTISFDPKLRTILQAQINPPQGLILRLDAIEEGSQPSSLFVPPAEHVVLMDVNKPGTVPQK